MYYLKQNGIQRRCSRVLLLPRCVSLISVEKMIKKVIILTENAGIWLILNYCHIISNLFSLHVTIPMYNRDFFLLQVKSATIQKCTLKRIILLLAGELQALPP